MGVFGDGVLSSLRKAKTSVCDLTFPCLRKREALPPGLYYLKDVVGAVVRRDLDEKCAGEVVRESYIERKRATAVTRCVRRHLLEWDT